MASRSHRQPRHLDTADFLPYKTRDGIRIEYVKSRRVVRIYGWTGNVGLHDPVEIELGVFCRRLGISAKDVAKSWRGDKTEDE